MKKERKKKIRFWNIKTKKWKDFEWDKIWFMRIKRKMGWFHYDFIVLEKDFMERNEKIKKDVNIHINR